MIRSPTLDSTKMLFSAMLKPLLTQRQSSKSSTPYASAAKGVFASSSPAPVGSFRVVSNDSEHRSIARGVSRMSVHAGL